MNKVLSGLVLAGMLTSVAGVASAQTGSSAPQVHPAVMAVAVPQSVMSRLHLHPQGNPVGGVRDTYVTQDKVNLVPATVIHDSALYMYQMVSVNQVEPGFTIKLKIPNFKLQTYALHCVDGSGNPTSCLPGRYYSVGLTWPTAYGSKYYGTAKSFAGDGTSYMVYSYSFTS